MMQSQTYDTKRVRPTRWQIFLHARKTFRLIGRLITDRRISLWRKLLFFSTIGGLLLLLLFPDLFNETFLSTIFPLIGTVAGVPIDAGFDWAAFALVALNLFKFFPDELLAEHYQRIFR